MSLPTSRLEYLRMCHTRKDRSRCRQSLFLSLFSDTNLLKFSFWGFALLVGLTARTSCFRINSVFCVLEKKMCQPGEKLPDLSNIYIHIVDF